MKVCGFLCGEGFVVVIGAVDSVDERC